MKLAITIPYYKKQFFAQTLKSLKEQTDSRFNLYIGNDASPEDPSDLIKKYLSEKTYKYIVYPDNLGGENLASQWERTIKETQGEEWIMVLGDDDALSPNAVEMFHKSLETANKHNINLIKYSLQLLNDDNIEIGDKTHYPEIFSSVQFLVDKKNLKNPSTISENIFRRSVYEKYRFKKYPLAWASDDMAWLEFTEFGNFYFIDQATCYIHFGSYNISGNKDKAEIKAYGDCLFYKDIFLNYSQHFQKKDLLKFLRHYELLTKDHQLSVDINLPKYYFLYGGIFQGILAIKRKYKKIFLNYLLCPTY